MRNSPDSTGPEMNRQRLEPGGYLAQAETEMDRVAETLTVVELDDP